jgi:pimeloyl-ACP methyl ester carboxylesterase
LPELATTVHFERVRFWEVEVFCREAELKTAPVLLLLRGFPTSSNLFCNRIPRLADRLCDRIRLSGVWFQQPVRSEGVRVQVENLTTIVEKLVDAIEPAEYSIYGMDYGAPIRYRLALRHPK